MKACFAPARSMMLSKAASLLGLARIDVAGGHYAESIRNGGASATLFRKLRDDANVAAAMTTSGIARLYSGDYPGALRDQEAALEIARRIKDQANEVTRLNNIGNVFYFQGRYSAALDRYSEAMQIVSRADAQPWVTSKTAADERQSGDIYQRLGLYDRALDTYGHMRLTVARRCAPSNRPRYWPIWVRCTGDWAIRLRRWNSITRRRRCISGRICDQVRSRF